MEENNEIPDLRDAKNAVKNMSIRFLATLHRKRLVLR